MKGKSQKSTTWLKSIITLIVTLLLGTTAWNGVQEDISNESNQNPNQMISTEESNDFANSTLDDIQSNTSTSESNNSNDELVHMREQVDSLNNENKSLKEEIDEIKHLEC